MEIQVTTDHNIAGGQAFNDYLGSELKEKLNRFDSYVTKLEVHLADENSHKNSLNDKRCILEANIKGRPSIAVTNHADTIENAFSGALSKLKASLDSHIGRLKEH